MVSPTSERESFSGFLHIYVDDADGAYDLALGAGATTLEAPFDTPTATAAPQCATPSATSSRSPPSESVE